MILFEPVNSEEEKEEEDDSEASIDDGVLAELSDGDTADDAEPEGFGHIDENPVEEEKKSNVEETAELEEDAEDVDFDSFDDVDEL